MYIYTYIHIYIYMCTYALRTPEERLPSGIPKEVIDRMMKKKNLFPGGPYKS